MEKKAEAQEGAERDILKITHTTKCNSTFHFVIKSGNILGRLTRRLCLNPLPCLQVKFNDRNIKEGTLIFQKLKYRV